jgi:Spy/CpxP family protein refolding chaperone
MQQTKLAAALVIIGAFVAGAAIGIAGDRALGPDGHNGGQGDSRSFWDRTATEWGLSPTQRATVDSLMDAQHRKISALYRPLRPVIDSVDSLARTISDSTQNALRAALTPDQQKKLDAMRAEMRRHDDDHRNRRKPPDRH